MPTTGRKDTPSCGVLRFAVRVACQIHSAPKGGLAKRRSRWLKVMPWAKDQAACSCLPKGCDTLLACFDFPAEHWGHLRTTNPIESTFATI